MIRMMLYLVTNGTEHAYWNSGHWDSTERFHGKCLLDDDDARDALRDLDNDNGEWFSKEVQIGVANDPAAELAALRTRVAELEGAIEHALAVNVEPSAALSRLHGILRGVTRDV